MSLGQHQPLAPFAGRATTQQPNNDGGCYDTAKRLNIESVYKEHCSRYGLNYDRITKVLPYDDSTLFCPSGMQQYKPWFSDVTIKGITLCNTQSCIRLNDLDLLGDGSHLGYFNMIGLFSFRHWTVPQTINFWMEYLGLIGVKPTHVTVHPTRQDWVPYHTLPVKFDENCTWTDGQIGGYCTEFYVEGVEIGNIVNPLGSCIDVGFGFERLDGLVNGTPVKSEQECLSDVILRVSRSGWT
jgi:alanyl-tRNA synthetase